MGTNWNSKESKYKPIVKESTKARARQAKKMFTEEGMSISDIADIMDLSVSRINEYLRNLKEDSKSTRKEEMLSRITEVEYYLTSKIINDRDYKPTTGDEDQHLRDELIELREKIAL